MAELFGFTADQVERIGRMLRDYESGTERPNIQRRRPLPGIVRTRLVELDATLTPGGNAAGFFVDWNGASYAVTTDSLTLYDEASHCFAMDGEWVWAYRHQQSGRWETSEPFGLRRHGQVDEVSGIASGAAGTIEIFTGQTPAITSPLVTVEAWHDWAEGSESLSNNDEVTIQYYTDAGAWFIDTSESPYTWLAGADVGSDATVTSGDLVDFVGGNGITTLVSTGAGPPDFTVTFLIEDSVAQSIALTATTGSVGGTNPVAIDDHGTTNTFGLVAGDNVTLTGGAGTVEIDVAGTASWTVNADSGGTGVVNTSEEVEFIGGNGIDTTYAADVSNHDVTIDIDDTVAQNIALTATGGSFGGTNPVLIDSHATANTFGLVAGDSIQLTGGTGTVEIDVTFSWSVTGDTGGTGTVDASETLDIVGGDGISTTYAANGSDHDVTVAIDDSVAQNIALTAGTEGAISGTNPVVIDSHPTANTFGLVAGAGTSLVGGTGTVEIKANTVMKLGKLDAQLTFGGNANVSIWTGTAGSETDSTVNENAHDWLLQSGETVASGKQVVIAWINDDWYVIAAQCPT